MTDQYRTDDAESYVDAMCSTIKDRADEEIGRYETHLNNLKARRRNALSAVATLCHEQDTFGVAVITEEYRNLFSEYRTKADPALRAYAKSKGRVFVTADETKYYDYQKHQYERRVSIVIPKQTRCDTLVAPFHLLKEATPKIHTEHSPRLWTFHFDGKEAIETFYRIVHQWKDDPIAQCVLKTE